MCNDRLFSRSHTYVTQKTETVDVPASRVEEVGRLLADRRACVVAGDKADLVAKAASAVAAVSAAMGGGMAPAGA